MYIKKAGFILVIVCCLGIAGTSWTQPVFNPRDINDLWYVWTEYNGPNTDIYCSHWNGSSWAEPAKLTDTSTSNFTPSVAQDKDGNPWVVWTGWDGVNTSIYCRHRQENGHWAPVAQVDDVDIYSDSAPAITFDSDNKPWVVWCGNDGRDDDIYVSCWEMKHWSSPIMINNDNLTPDIMPAIISDSNNNIIIAWCGFDTDRYKLFCSTKKDKRWSTPKLIIPENNRFSADLPGMLKTRNAEVKLLWYENNQCYESLWNGSIWSQPQSAHFLLPEDFLEKFSIGPAYISWNEHDIFQSIRIIPPQQQKEPITARYPYQNTSKYFAWIDNLISPSAYAEAEPTRYVAFGNSVTEGVGATDPRSTYAYPPRLEEKLNLSIGSSVVYNLGVGGERTIDGLDRMDSVIAQYNPQYVLILEGINDMTYQYSTSTIIFNLGQMIDKVIAFGATPLLASLPPRTDCLANRVKDDMNPAIQRLAEEKVVTFVDQYTTLAEDTDIYMSDRKHPNDAGYEIMATNWFNAIASIIVPPDNGDNGGGCGALPPIYRNNNNGPNNNLLYPLLAVLILLWGRKRIFR